MGKNVELPLDDTILQVLNIDGDSSFLHDPNFTLQHLNDTMKIEGHKTIDKMVQKWGQSLRIEDGKQPEVEVFNQYGDQSIHIIFDLKDHPTYEYRYLIIRSSMNTTYNKLCIRIFGTMKLEDEYIFYGDQMNVESWVEIDSQSSSFRITNQKIRTKLKKYFELKLEK